MRTNIYVVPSLKAKEKLQDEGRAWAEEKGFSFVPRRKRTISDLMKDYGENFLVYSSRGPQIDRPEGSHFFSLNMAELRIQHLRKGQPDHLLTALQGGTFVRRSLVGPRLHLRFWRRLYRRLLWIARRIDFSRLRGVASSFGCDVLGVFPLRPR